MPSPRTPSLRRRVRQGLECALERTGLATAWGTLCGDRGAVVLSYHSIPSADLAPWIDPEYSIDPGTFAEQVRFLAERCNVLSLEELLGIVTAGKALPSRAVAITFDDGYLDNLTVAAGILESAGLPATCFLATRYVDESEPQWIDRLYGAFRHRTRQELDLREQGHSVWTLTDQAGVDAAYREVAGRLLRSSWEDRKSVLGLVEAQLAVVEQRPRTTMNWDDVRSWGSVDGFSVGGHTADHVDLLGDRTDAAAQIRRCAQDIRDQLGAGPAHFSYPYGRWDPSLREPLLECGFTAALTTEPVAVQQGVDVLAVPRSDAPVAPWEFRLVSTGVAHTLRRRR